MNNIINTSEDIKNELSKNFIEYAVACNTDRALPDSTSGLKPVTRRIIWEAYSQGFLSNKEHVKCARIVGQTMSNTHPHGDSSIYGALVRLSQDWVMRYPLIDFHGNMGNIAGDGPAAYRYTNARLAKITEDGMLMGIKKKNVDFIPNYDENGFEPATLPSYFPNLLCNPNTGIGVALASEWPCNNLVDVANAIYAYMDGKEIPIVYADFPTGGIIINKDIYPEIMSSGKGTIKIRGKYKITKQEIHFYEIPYGTTIESLIKQVGEVSDSKEIEGINEVRDESGRKGIDVVIECTKGFSPEEIVKKLFAKTDFQSSFSYNQVALVDKVPTLLNFKQCIEIYINHNENCIKREAEFDLNKAKERQEIVEGLLKALEDIDNVIAIIKKSKSSADAVINLINKYNFTQNQAKAIVDMKLGKLAGLEKIELQDEHTALINQIEDLTLTIVDKNKRISILRERLQEIVKKYGDARKTEVAQLEIPSSTKEKIKEEIPDIECILTITNNGYIKRKDLTTVKITKRGGKGAVLSEDESILTSMKAHTSDYLAVFTSHGKMHRILVNNIPNEIITAASTLFKFEDGETIMAGSCLHTETMPKYLITVTAEGYVKKSELAEYATSKRAGGIAAAKLKDGDKIVSIIFQDEEDLILLSKHGYIIRFATQDIAAVGRTALGVKGMKLIEGDKVAIALPVHKESDYLAIVGVDGIGKKIELNEIPVQGRYGRGVLSGCHDIAGALFIDDNDTLTITSQNHSINIAATEIPLLHRVAKGDILIKDAIVQSVTKI